MRSTDLPVAVLGAGPVVLTVAARQHRRGFEPLLLERGNAAGTSVAELAGDPVAARDARLELTETRVCRTAPTPKAADGCRGGAPKADASACCAFDEAAKAEGKSGCGCGARANVALTA